MRRFWHERFADLGSGPGQAGEQRRSLARALLLLAVGALCLAALVAIGILLFGSFGETEGKILLTVLGIAGYSLLGLGATTALGREPIWLGPLGLGVSVVGFFLFVGQIWISPQGDLLGRLMGTFLVVAVAIAHAALLLLLTRRAGGTPAETVRRATLLMSTVLTVMLVTVILFDWEPGQLYFRLMGTVAVLTVLGTLLTPILQRLAAGAGAARRAIGAGAVADADLEVRYKGRGFAVRARADEAPDHGVVVEVWEVTAAGREAVTLPSATPAYQDRPAALARAVQEIILAVDTEERLSQARGNPAVAEGRTGVSASVRTLSNTPVG